MEGNILKCVECGLKFDCQTDLWICEDCQDKFNLNKLWDLHDKNKIDALDFNENQKVREQFRI